MYSWGDSPIIVMGVIIQYLLGVKIRGLLPLRVLKCKITMARVIAVSFRL